MKSINVKTLCKIASEIESASYRKKFNGDLYGQESKFTVKYIELLKEKHDEFAADKAFTAIDEILQDVQKRCSVRIITVLDIVSELNKVQKKLNVSQKALDGTRVFIDLNAQTFPSAYKCDPMSTRFSAEYKNGAWRVINIRRDTCKTTKYSIELSDNAKLAILNNASTLNL